MRAIGQSILDVFLQYFPEAKEHKIVATGILAQLPDQSDPTTVGKLRNVVQYADRLLAEEQARLRRGNDDSDRPGN